jgi:hypothetical protein
MMPTHIPASAEVAPGTRASFGRVLRDQRKTMLVALALVVADFWVRVRAALRD